MKVIVIGSGQLGLSTAVRFARDHQVVCTDLDAKRIAELTAGGGNNQEINDLRERRRIRFTTNLQDNVSDADVVLVTQDAMLSFDSLRLLIDDILAGLTDNLVLIIRSPIHLDECRELREYINRHASHDIDLVVNPRVDDADRTILVGTYDSGGYRMIEALYDGCEVYSTDVTTALVADMGLRFLRMERERVLKHVVLLCEQQGGNRDALLRIIGDVGVKK